MPRKARILMPTCRHHLLQRGHNRGTGLNQCVPFSSATPPRKEFFQMRTLSKPKIAAGLRAIIWVLLVIFPNLYALASTSSGPAYYPPREVWLIDHVYTPTPLELSTESRAAMQLYIGRKVYVDEGYFTLTAINSGGDIVNRACFAKGNGKLQAFPTGRKNKGKPFVEFSVANGKMSLDLGGGVVLAMKKKNIDESDERAFKLHQGALQRIADRYGEQPDCDDFVNKVHVIEYLQSSGANSTDVQKLYYEFESKEARAVVESLFKGGNDLWGCVLPVKECKRRFRDFFQARGACLFEGLFEANAHLAKDVIAYTWIKRWIPESQEYYFSKTQLDHISEAKTLSEEKCEHLNIRSFVQTLSR